MAFESLEALFVDPTASLRSVMGVFNDNAARTDGSGVALVVESTCRLCGIVTDGDVRRALLAGFSVDDPVTVAMTREPVVAREETTAHQLLRLFDRPCRHVPLVDGEGRVVDLLLYSQLQIGRSYAAIIVRAKAPLRISFAGGGNDFTKHFASTSSSVISVTIDRYCHGTLKRRNDTKVTIYSEDYDAHVEAASVGDLVYDGTLDLLKAVIRLMRPEYGFDLVTRSDVLPGTGLGSSAAMAAVVIGLLNDFCDRRMNEYQISDLAYQAERIELGISGGWQDQYAVAFGGLNYIEFTNKDVIVHPLALKEHVVHELEESLILCATGQTRNSGAVHSADARLDRVLTDAARARLATLATEVKNALVQGKLESFAALLDEAWQFKKLNGTVTNGRIDRLYDTARAAGCLGGKLVGAGQGGYLLLFCPPLKRRQALEALESAGGTPSSFNFDFRGLRVWSPVVSPAVGPSTAVLKGQAPARV